MKNILYTLLIAATSANAQMEITGQALDRILTVGGPAVFLSSDMLDCEPYETFTEWEVSYKGDQAKKCFEHENAKYTAHTWVYAEREDVNTSWALTYAVHCPCGCSQSEYQARICSGCLRHEGRVREFGFKQAQKKESEYKRLLKRIKE